MKRAIMTGLALIIVAGFVLATNNSKADEFTKEELKQWEANYQAAVKKGRSVFTDPTLGSNGVVCAQCHPNATNTHPETYPKYQKQKGRVVGMWEMVNWCIENPLEGNPLKADDPRMIAILAYIHDERKGVKLTPGKH